MGPVSPLPGFAHQEKGRIERGQAWADLRKQMGRWGPASSPEARAPPFSFCHITCESSCHGNISSEPAQLLFCIR